MSNLSTVSCSQTRHSNDSESRGAAPQAAEHTAYPATPCENRVLTPAGPDPACKHHRPQGLTATGQFCGVLWAARRTASPAGSLKNKVAAELQSEGLSVQKAVVHQAQGSAGAPRVLPHSSHCQAVGKPHQQAQGCLLQTIWLRTTQEIRSPGSLNCSTVGSRTPFPGVLRASEPLSHTFSLLMGHFASKYCRGPR